MSLIQDLPNKKCSTRECESKVCLFLQSAAPAPNKGQEEQAEPVQVNASDFTPKNPITNNSFKTIIPKF